MDNIWSMMDIIFAGAGAYMLYAWILMKKTGEIKTSLLLSKEVDIRKCKDLEGYKNFMAPKMLVFGITALVYGGYGLVNSYVFSMPMPVYWAVMAGFFAVLVWFSVQSRKSVEMFW
ncbi:MAG: hypothetical protein HFH25_09430 [Lachnospiraceae bacterium]|nr:hypothetical protein [Lachnospiraceae bacterium]